VIEEPGWSETIRFPRREEAQVRDLAEKIEIAAGQADEQRGKRRAAASAAEEEIASAESDRRGVVEAQALVHRLGELCDPAEDVLDMVPAISAGHDGVLVATDRRLLFVAPRRTLSFPYSGVSHVAARGRMFGTRLAISTTDGDGVFSGVRRDHASAIADLVRERAGAAA
jgi:hypothetical protein